jgi:DNA-binding NtrC family response regulator
MSEKVLLIDDDQDFLSIMSERMEIRDIEVTTALSGEKALSLVEDVSYDAIILDLNMPNMDGLQTLEKLKAINPDLQIILLTGHATVAKGVQAMKLGATDVMEKPVDINALAEKIKSAHVKKIIMVEKRAEEKIRSILGTKWF